MIKGKSPGDSSVEQGAAKTPAGLRGCKSKPKKKLISSDHLPLNIHWEVEGKAKDLWNSVKNMSKEDLHQEVAD